jgi:ABC-type branched-subunit amino acid transport system substrate-binding protein
MTTTATTSTTPRRLRATAAGLAALTLFGGGVVACSHDKQQQKASPAVAKTPAGGTVTTAPASLTAPPALTIGVIASSNGEGSQLYGEAAGAQVAAFRLNGLAPSGAVQLKVEDDHGDPVEAVAAVQRLADAGVSAIVYASTGDHVLGAVQAAAQAGVPVLLPYDGDARVLSAGKDVYETGPTDAQAAARLAKWTSDHHQARVAVIHDQGALGVAGRDALRAAGLTPATDVPFDGGANADQVAAAKAAVAGSPDAIIVWADIAGAQHVLAGLQAAGNTAPVLLSPASATSAFGRLQVGSLAPAGTDGLLSAGSWAGSWTPTSAVDAFYAARAKAAASGAFPGVDLGTAGIGTHDAVIAVADAARTATSGSRSAVRDALRGLKPSTAGAPLDLSKQAALADGSVAITVYTTVPDSSGRSPDPGNAGGRWMAVPGTYTPPSQLAGVDDPFGA